VSILIVEDEAVVLTIARDSLEDAGFDVVSAEDGPTALALLRDVPNGLTGLVADYSLGSSVTGREVIEAMRRLYPKAPIILASAFPDAVSNEWRWQHNVELLIKPYRTMRLVEVMKQLFRIEALPSH
jgi:CheY-like chemotaxis protein